MFIKISHRKLTELPNFITAHLPGLKRNQEKPSCSPNPLCDHLQEFCCSAQTRTPSQHRNYIFISHTHYVVFISTYTGTVQPKINHWPLSSLITGRAEAPLASATLALTAAMVMDLTKFGQLKSLALWKQQSEFVTDHWVRLQGHPKGKWISRRPVSRSGEQVVQSHSDTKQIIFLMSNSYKLVPQPFVGEKERSSWHSD